MEDVKTELAGPVDIGMEHLTDELHPRWLVGVLFFKVHHQAECAVFEGSVGGADDDGIPAL